MKKPTPSVLIIGGGALQMRLIQEAQSLGFYTIVTDIDKQAPGRDIAGLFFAIDTYDIPRTVTMVESLLASASQRGIQLQGVVTAGADVAPTVAAAAAKTRVPGIPQAVAERTHNKAAVRDTLLTAGLQCYQPEWMHWVPDAETYPLEEAVAGEIGYPCIVKPLQQRASRGMTIVQAPHELKKAVEKATVHGTTFLVEAYLQGTEHSVEAILNGDDILWFNVVDRFFDYTHYASPMELGHSNPSTLSPIRIAQLKLMLRLIASALGVYWGPFKMDVLWTEDGPKLLEATARLSGGWDSQGTSPLTHRYPLRILLQLACNVPLIDVQDEADRYAACAAILPTLTGELRDIAYAPDWPVMTAMAAEIIWNVAPGAMLTLDHCAARPGFVLSHGETATEAWNRAHQVATYLAGQMEIA